MNKVWDEFKINKSQWSSNCQWRNTKLQDFNPSAVFVCWRQPGSLGSGWMLEVNQCRPVSYILWLLSNPTMWQRSNSLRAEADHWSQLHASDQKSSHGVTVDAAAIRGQHQTDCDRKLCPADKIWSTYEMHWYSLIHWFWTCQHLCFCSALLS